MICMCLIPTFPRETIRSTMQTGMLILLISVEPPCAVSSVSVERRAVVNAGLTLTLSSGSSIENVNGGSLNDTFVGNSGNNTLSGGAGNDTFKFNTSVSLGSDTVNDSEGIDTLSFVGSTAGVAVNLGLASAQTVNDNLILRLTSVTAIENLTGGTGNDTLTGNSLNNILLGDAGNDALSGVSGNDVYMFNTNSALGSDTILKICGRRYFVVRGQHSGFLC